MRRYLIIPKDGVAEDWYKDFGFVIHELRKTWDDGSPMIPSRVMAYLSEAEALGISEHPDIEYIGCNEAATDQEISDIMLCLYGEGNAPAEKAADSLLDLMVHIKKHEKK